ncbi:MAG: hypothetical protein WAK69_06330 [Rhodoplanes sp.]
MPVPTDPHDEIKIAFVLIRAFNGRGVLPKIGIVGSGRLAREKF